MATRCQISFRTTWRRARQDGTLGAHRSEERWVYRHWDGYPEAVLPDLVAFLAWNGGAQDPEYTAANFLYWSKLRATDPRLGFGVCTPGELHGDIEYFYEVVTSGERPDAITLAAYAVDRRPGTRVTRESLRHLAPSRTIPRNAPPMRDEVAA